MRRGITYLLVFVVLLAAPSGIRYLRYYDLGAAEQEAPPAYDPAKIAEVPTPAASSFTDEPVSGHGLILLDQAHGNQFTLGEIGYLDGRLAARGYELLPFTGGDMATALRSVNGLIVLTPLQPYETAELQAVTDFVDRGGRLLLVGDPTRFNLVFNEEDVFDPTFSLETDKIPLNSLANEFDIIFNGDYLYNTVENEGNFRNIILKDNSLGEGSLVDGLEKLAFYGSHSLQIGPGGSPLLMGDDNTWSSATDRPGGLVLAATSVIGRVLALGDIHFLTEPYFTVFDNSQFIARIADFLVEPAGRGFVLADFPYFYRRSINLVYTGNPELGPDAFDEIIALQDAFRRVDQSLSLAAAPDPDRDTLYLGLYNQADDVAEILATAGISLTIDPPILTDAELKALETESGLDTGDGDTTTDGETTGGDSAEDNGETNNGQDEEQIRLIQSVLGKVQMSGTALILLDESEGQRNVVVLAASHDGLENTINRLLNLVPLNADYALSDCLLQDTLALCPSNVVDEEVEAELDTGGAPESAVVEDTNGGSDNGGEPPTDGGAETPNELDAVYQGQIGIDEPVQGVLAEGESHSWSFTGPEAVDIVVQGGGDMDAILELYDPNNELVQSADSSFTGESEQLLGMDLGDGDYSIVVRDFFADGGTYTLTVTLANAVGDSGGGIFIFADDDGVPLGDGLTSADSLAALLGDQYPVTTWAASVDGPLQEDTLNGIDLLVWDSGDFRDEEGFLGPDVAIILDYLNNGGDLLLIGSSPALFGDLALSSVSDLEITGEDAILLAGLTSGDVIPLDQSYDAVSTALIAGSFGDETTEFFLRGPASEEGGSFVGLATVDPTLPDQNTVLFLLPFFALPPNLQAALVTNFLNWFNLGSG
ncbi:MAG: hypothetical protein ACE5E7_11245 [Anaerolineae bacterium]